MATLPVIVETRAVQIADSSPQTTPEPDLARLDEEALRVLFFARIAVSDVGGKLVSCPHLLIGVTQVVPALLNAVLADGWNAAKLRDGMAAALQSRERVTKDVDVPLSPGVRRTLQRATMALDASEQATPTHLFVSVLGEREELAAVASVLREAGVRLR